MAKARQTLIVARPHPRVASSTNPFQTFRIVEEPGMRQFEVKTVEVAGEPIWLKQIIIEDDETAVVSDVATRDIPSFDQKFVERR